MMEYDATNDDQPTRAHMTRAQLEARYPRLLRIASWCGILSHGEAIAWLTDYRAGRTYSSEAVRDTARLMSDVVKRRTNYSLLATLGISTQQNCRVCLLWRECDCPCTLCVATRTTELTYGH